MAVCNSLAGPLFVNAGVWLEHTESSKERPNHFNFYRMWVRNRYYIVQELSNRKYQPAFHWCNFGKFLSILTFAPKDPIKFVLGTLGMVLGFVDVVKAKYAS
jgi:hypothetical protein